MALLLDLIALLPYIGPVIAVPLYPLAFFLTGLIAVRITPYSPSVGEAATGGATAGFIAAIIGGLGAMFLYPIRLNIAGGPEDLVKLLVARHGPVAGRAGHRPGRADGLHRRRRSGHVLLHDAAYDGDPAGGAGRGAAGGVSADVIRPISWAALDRSNNLISQQKPGVVS